MPNLKEILKEFVATANAGQYKTEGELLSAFPELSGYNSNTLKEFVATANAGQYASEDELLATFPEFGQPVKKKDEAYTTPLWQQPQGQPEPEPRQEQTLPFLESKPSGISLGSQRVPEEEPMFEAPPMRTAEEVQAIVEAPEVESKVAESEQGWLLNTVSSLDRGFAKNLIGNPVKGMGTLLEGATSKVFGGTGKGPISDALINFGNYYNNAIDELTPQDENFKNTLTDQFGQAFGQVASLIMTGGIAGASKQGSTVLATAPTGIMGVVGATGKQLASTLASPVAISGGLSMGQAEFDRAKEAGATDEQAYEVFFKNAAVGSVLEQIPVMQFLKRFNQSTAGGVTNYIKTKGVAGLTGGFEEMTTEVLQQLYSNKTAQEIYNINQQLLEGVGESGGVGFGVGFILNAMGARVKKLKKEGNTQEAQLIEAQIDNFESKPKGPPPTYSINGIKIEAPEVINQMIDNMDATDLSNSNIEITNDPELNVKLQDKMVTSSIKEEVRSANPDIDENTLDQITALEKERKKFEGKKTQSAKDKLASINSQIKTLQENAVQKPSTEESVLRAEESQVGLPEVGEGDTKVQAPTEEVVQEEVVDEEAQASIDRLLSLDETEAVAEQPILSEESQKVKTQLEDFQNAFDEAYNAEYPKSGTAQDKRSATAKSKRAVKKLQQMIGFDIGAYWELDADQTKKREALYSLRENKDYDSYDEMVAAYQKDVAEGNQSELVTSINTLLGVAPKEMEVVSPATPVVEESQVGGFNSSTTGNKMWDGIVKKGDAEIVQMSPDEFINAVPSVSEKLKAVGFKDIDPKTDKKVLGIIKSIRNGKKLDALILDKANTWYDGIHRALAAKELGIKKIPVAINKSLPSKKVSSKIPKAKSLPIPVAIPKPAPAPAPKPVAVEQSTATEPTTIYASDGSLFQAYMKDEIGKAFRNLGFKKFANLFRKHVDPSFSRANNTKTAGGQVDKDFTFEELAGYIIGDGTYSITEDQYRAFAKEAGIDMPAPAPKPVAVEGKFKKLKSLKDIQEDPRVESIYKERDDEGVSWWIELKDGYEWAYNSQIIHEYTVNGLLGVMNNDVQAVAKTAPQTTPTAVAPAPAPAPKPVAVVSQPQEDVKIYSYNGRNYEIKRLSVKEVGTDKGLPLEFGRIIKAQGKLLTPAAPVVAKAKTKAAPKVEPVKVAPAIVSKPAPASKPVIVPAPTTIVGPVQLREAHMASVNAVRIDQTLTQRQKDAKVDALKVEYQARKAEMESTAPVVAKPKTESKAKTKAAPKKVEPVKVEVKVEPVVKSKFQEAQDFADKLSAMPQEERDDVEFDENYRGYQLFEARKGMPKTPNSPKFKKVDKDNTYTIYNEYDYIANIDGEPYGLVKYDDPDDPDNDKAFVWAYEKVGTADLFQTWTNDNEELISEIKSKLPQEVKAAPKKVEEEDGPSLEDLEEVDDIVDEDEDGDEDTKDLEFKRESFGEKGIRYSDKWLSALDKQSKGSLNSGIAIPVARIILKTIKALLKTGITINQAITKIAADMNLAKKDIIESLKELDAIYLSQSALAKVRAQVNLEVTAALASKRSVNEQRKNLSNTIKEMETTGKISAAKAKVILNKIGKLNLDSKVAVEKFIDYVGKIFADAEYANKLNTAKDTRSQIRKLSKSKEKFANLRDLGSKFAGIDPSMIEDIDEYNEMATLIRDSIKGSTTRKADVKFANMIKESDAMAYINKAMEAQQKILLSQKQAEVQELLDIDASDLTYDQLMELVDSDKPLTKDNEGLIRAAINKAFRVYSSMIDASMRNGKDVFTDDDVPYTTNQKKVVKGFMSIDLSVLSPKQALEAVDALVNFLQNQSIAKMESVLAKYKGETEMRAIEKKGIKGKPIRKYWSKGLGKLLVEQTANLPIVFERMFGGFTKGGMVQDAMGVTALINGKSKAQSESNSIVNKYVDKFYKLKPNGEVFNTALNNIERGMVAFMSRNVIGTDSEMKVEFKRRRDLIEESITELEKGNEQEVAKAKVYQEIYDKVLKDSDSIEQVQSKAAPENLEAVKFWQEEWTDKYEQLSDTALGVYNKILEKDINYTPDRYNKLSSDTGEIDITTEDMGFLVNSGTAPLYKKETGVLMAATRPESLPKSKGTSKTNRYIDLSFDNANSNAMYDALVDINTAAPIRQVQSALNSDSFARIMKGTGDEKLIRNRIDLFVRNIRKKNPFSNDEFSKAAKNLNRIASIGVGQALGGVLQPIKQVVPIATNTLINAGGLDVQSTFDLAKQEFMDKSGYAIANRGVESQAQIESLNKMIEEAAKSKPEQAIKAIEKINNWWLKSFLVKPDVYIARASWMTYYEKSLKKQGINPKSINYKTHEINEQAANYAQRQVDRQQNISDADLAGALLSDKSSGKQLFVKVLMPFASFRMNQSARLGSDLSTITDKTATVEDKKIAWRSVGGFAAEMAVFRAISAGSALLIAAAVKGIMGRDDDEEKEKKKNDAIVKGQLTSTVADVFSPTPLFDKAIQIGASAILDATQDALDVSEEERLEIYSGNKQDFFQSLGLLGISGARASQLYDMSVLAAGGSYEDDYGRKKYLSEKDRDAISALIPVAILSNIGLAPSEVNSIVRSSLSDAKRNGTTIESGQPKSKSEESKIMGLNKEDLKRYYPDIYEQNYGEGTPDAEKRKLDREENEFERQMKDEEYNYEPKDGVKKEGRDSRSRGTSRDAMRRKGGR